MGFWPFRRSSKAKPAPLRVGDVGPYADLSARPNPDGLALISMPKLAVVAMAAARGGLLTRAEFETVRGKSGCIAMPHRQDGDLDIQTYRQFLQLSAAPTTLENDRAELVDAMQGLKALLDSVGETNWSNRIGGVLAKGTPWNERVETEIWFDPRMLLDLRLCDGNGHRVAPEEAPRINEDFERASMRLWVALERLEQHHED
ncbi:MAG: hypothetical protein R3D63_14225 [Paracoccaceae bacterium]